MHFHYAFEKQCKWSPPLVFEYWTGHNWVWNLDNRKTWSDFSTPRRHPVCAAFLCVQIHKKMKKQLVVSCLLLSPQMRWRMLDFRAVHVFQSNVTGNKISCHATATKKLGKTISKKVESYLRHLRLCWRAVNFWFAVFFRKRNNLKRKVYPKLSLLWSQ